jgi:hypothetical protein
MKKKKKKKLYSSSSKNLSNKHFWGNRILCYHSLAHALPPPRAGRPPPLPPRSYNSYSGVARPGRGEFTNVKQLLFGQRFDTRVIKFSASRLSGNCHTEIGECQILGQSNPVSRLTSTKGNWSQI